MPSELPSYHHLSPAQIVGLSFRVSLRPAGSAIDEASGGGLLSKDIAWQEKVPKIFGPSNRENHRVCIFTYTNADAVPYDDKSPSCKNGDAILAEQGFSLRNETYARDKHSHQAKLKDRMLREDSCKIMVIMAAVSMNSSTESQEKILCVIKVYPSGLVSSCPALSDVETEDLDDSSVFMSRRSIDQVICKGPRLATYSFASAKSVYEYTIEWNGARALDDELEVMIAEQHNIDKEAVDERRDLIRSEFDSFDCMYEENTWKNQAHVEIVSVDGFAESNMLLCLPLGSDIVVHYRIMKDGDVILKSATSTVRSYSVCRCLEFTTNFVVAFIGVFVVSFAIFSFSYCGSEHFILHLCCAILGYTAVSG